jgi:iron complex outermembrane receptor protein
MDKLVLGRRVGGNALVMAAVAVTIASIQAPGAQAAEAEAAELAEVVVTGSRIVRRDYESQSPIVTVQGETFEDRSAIGIEAALNQLPQFSPAGTSQNAPGGDASTPFPSPTAAPGAATVDLRGLGTNRSLVLVDGRRVQPVNGNLVVDLNTIPSAAIQSVEVISGGAAAVYGADAIAGVVNLILKKNFEGFEVDAQYGMTQRGDGEELQLSGLFGANYGDGRGNVMFGANYAKRNGIRSRDRSWVRAGWDDPGTAAGGAGTAGGLSQFECQAPGPFTPGNCPPPDLFPMELGATIWNIDQNGNLFDVNDPLNPAHPYTGPLGGTSGFKINPNGTLGYTDRESGMLSLPLERWSMFASTHYDLTDKVELFADARFSESFVSATGTHVALWNIWSIQVPYNQAYDDPDSPTFGQGPAGFAHHPVPAALADLLNARVSNDPSFDPLTAPWQYNGSVDYLPPYRTDTTSNVYQLIVGLRGKLPLKDWSWEVYGSHGKASVNAHLPESFLSHPKVQQLFEQDQYGRGWINPAIIAAAGRCTSGLPIFNPDGSVNDTPSVSQDCADYVTLRMNNISSIKQQVLEGTVQGTIADLWAGPLQFAAGLTYRSERFQFTPDSAYNANQDAANVVNNIALPLGVNGLTYVKEAYAEFAIPLLTDVPLVKKLSIEPGIRFSDYKTGGSLKTWKVLGDWQVNDFIRFRGGVQRANRAPNITELYMPVGAAAIATAIDGCGYWENFTPDWANHPDNPNRLNVQALCQELMVRDGAPPSLYVPGEDSANNYRFNVFGPSATAFPFDLAVQGGNPDLDSEKAETFTIGTVLRLPFQAEALRRLTLSVDWYDIDLKGAIGIPDQPTVYRQCLDARFNSLVGDAPGSHSGAELAAGNPYCALIQREYTAQFPYGADRRYRAQYVNLGGIRTSGLDVQLDWSAELSGIGFRSAPGSVSANIQFNYLDSFARSPFPGGDYVEERGTSSGGDFHFKNRWLTTLGYRNGPFGVGLRWQHLPSVAPGTNAPEFALPLASHDQFDLFGRYSVNSRVELRFGIDNLFDADPEEFGAVYVPGVPEDSNNARGSTNLVHDSFGRRFYLGAKVSF